MLASPHVIAEVADCVRWADRLVRADLIHGFVVTENDYTSNFTSAFRREINSRRLPGLSAHSQVLTPSVERRTGTDGCIVFHNQSVFKVGLFEGKWPRLSTHLNYWDSIQKSTGKSHFDDQLGRQAALSGYAIWEMFYSEEPYGANKLFPDEGSSCVWHDDAFVNSSSRNQTSPWTDAELSSLLSSKGKNIGQIVTSICECKKGKTLPTSQMQDHLRDIGIKGNVLVIDLGEEPNIEDKEKVVGL